MCCTYFFYALFSPLSTHEFPSFFLLERVKFTFHHVSIKTYLPIHLPARRQTHSHSTMYLLKRTERTTKLNELGGANGIGLADLVENRLVGMKSRGVYETPGGAILYKAHEVLETITLDKETARVKQYLSIKFADIVYNGQWFTPLREAMSAFVTETQKTVTGDVKLKLYKGNMINAGVTSPYTLYDEEVATFDEDNVYNQADSAGFINLFGLPIKVRAKLEQKRNAKKD